MATDRTAFPATKAEILVCGNNVQSFIASGAITKGQVVAIDATGVSMTVRAAVVESGEAPIGVAIASVTAAEATAGKQVPVAMIGCIVYVSNYASDVDMDAGDYVTTNDCAIGGSVITCSGAATQELVGRMLEDSTAASLTMEQMKVKCGCTNVIHA